MSGLLLAAGAAAAQRPAAAGNQNPYWVFEAADGSDHAVSFWNQGQASAVGQVYSWMFGSGAPTWHYAALPNPNPTVNFSAPQTLIDDNRGRLYLSQRGALTPAAGNAHYTSAVYMSDVQPGAPAGSARLLADVKGQPEMLLVPTLTSSGLAGSPNIGLFCGGAYALYYEATSGAATDGTGNLHARFIKPSGNPPTTDNQDNVVAFKTSSACNHQLMLQEPYPARAGRLPRRCRTCTPPPTSVGRWCTWPSVRKTT